MISLISRKQISVFYKDLMSRGEIIKSKWHPEYVSEHPNHYFQNPFCFFLQISWIFEWMGPFDSVSSVQTAQENIIFVQRIGFWK